MGGRTWGTTVARAVALGRGVAPRLVIVMVAATLLALGAARAASADSVVYIKGGQPYIAAANGSDAHLVTSDQPGNWAAVTAAANGTVYAGTESYDVEAYAPGAPARSIPAVDGGLGLTSLDVAPNDSAIAWMGYSANDYGGFRHDSYATKLGGSANTAMFVEDYWPQFQTSTDLWLAGNDGLLHYDPATNLQSTATPPPGVSDVLEMAVAPGGAIVAMRTGGSVENFSSTPCPPGESCPAQDSQLVISKYANGQATATCVFNALPFQKLTWSSDGTLLAFSEPDGIHELRVGAVDSTCANFTDLGLVVPGGSSPDFTTFADRSAFPYVPGSGLGPSPGPGPSPAPGPAPKHTNKHSSKATRDAIKKIKVVPHRSRAGKRVRLEVTLRSSHRIVVVLLHHVTASGHGKHRHRAHDVVLETIHTRGKKGANTVSLLKVRGHRLAVGSYKLKVSAGGRAHTVSFSVVRR